MSKKNILISISVLLLMIGCAEAPSVDEIAVANYGPAPDGVQAMLAGKNQISKTLIDPYSAVIKCGVPVKGWLNSAFKNYFGYMMGCTVNAKNRFGGYVGEKEVYFWIRDNGMTEIAPPFKFQPMK